MKVGSFSWGISDHFNSGIPILVTSYFRHRKESLVDSKEISQMACCFLNLECKSSMKL